MRTPTSIDERWRWWEAAISGAPLPVHDGDIHCGYFRVRKFPYGQWPTGPFVGARIWMVPADIDEETGELLGPETWLAEIDGKRANPWRCWTWLAASPITEEEYKWLTALSPLLPKKSPNKSVPIKR